MPHLWEIDHPYYGADGYLSEFEDFAEMREAIDALDEDMNHIYRWDWEDDVLSVFMVMPRKSGFLEFSCPVTRDQESEVLEWLRGPRVLGALRTLWEPLLTHVERGA